MNKNILNMAEMDRRALLKAAGMGALALTGAGIASSANATPEDAAAYINKMTGGASGTANSGKVNIKLPEIAENGATVPITVSVDSPMTSGDHVKHIHIVAEGNPNPEVISFNLTPSNGKAEVATRMRLGKTQNIVAAAVMSDGTVHTNLKNVKVTIGGCGG